MPRTAWGVRPRCSMAMTSIFSISCHMSVAWKLHPALSFRRVADYMDNLERLPTSGNFLLVVEGSIPVAAQAGLLSWAVEPALRRARRICSKGTPGDQFRFLCQPRRAFLPPGGIRPVRSRLRITSSRTEVKVPRVAHSRLPGTPRSSHGEHCLRCRHRQGPAAE